MQAAQVKFLGGIEGKTRNDRVSNEDIRQMMGIMRLRDMIETTKVKWYGYIMIMGEERVCKKGVLRQINRKLQGRLQKR